MTASLASQLTSSALDLARKDRRADRQASSADAGPAAVDAAVVPRVGEAVEGLGGPGR